MQARLPLVVISVALAASAISRTELNSFLNRPAATSSQLVRQLKTDRVVADRYMRHFAMSKSQLVDLFSHLSVRAIAKAAHFEVYNVPSNGVLRMRHLLFGKGTKIWVDALGKPILKVSCGNPLTKGPNSPVALSEDDSPVQSVPVEDFRPILVENAPIVIEEQLPVAMAMEPPTPEIVVTEVPIEEPPTVGPTTIGEAPVIIAPAPTSNFFTILPSAIISILPIISGNSNNIPPPIPPGPPVVPEPGSWIAIVGGCAMLAITRRKILRRG